MNEFGLPGALVSAHQLGAAWRASTDAGNAALANGDAGAALASYEMALDEAERLLAGACEETAALLLAPMTLTISLANLAELRRRANDREGAFKLKWRAVERLMEIADDGSAHAALRLNCVRHLKYALALLAEDAASDLSRRAELDDMVRKARRVMDEVFEDLRSLNGRDDQGRPPSIQPIYH